MLRCWTYSIPLASLLPAPLRGSARSPRVRVRHHTRFPTGSHGSSSGSPGTRGPGAGITCLALGRGPALRSPQSHTGPQTPPALCSHPAARGGGGPLGLSPSLQRTSSFLGLIHLPVWLENPSTHARQQHASTGIYTPVVSVHKAADPGQPTGLHASRPDSTPDPLPLRRKEIPHKGMSYICYYR